MGVPVITKVVRHVQSNKKKSPSATLKLGLRGAACFGFCSSLF